MKPQGVPRRPKIQSPESPSNRSVGPSAKRWLGDSPSRCSGVGSYRYCPFTPRAKETFQLYNLKTDPTESQNLIDTEPETAERMVKLVRELAASIEKSDQGLDYPEGSVVGVDPGRRFWAEDPAYEPHLEMLFQRPEYAGQVKHLKK